MRSLQTILGSRQRSTKDLLYVTYQWLLVSSLVRRYRRAAGTYLFDHGLFQSLWSIGISAGNTRFVSAARRLAASMPTPFLIVVVEASIATIERRQANRSGAVSRIETWCKESPDILHRAVALLGDVRDVANSVAARGNSVRILVIDNDRDTDLDNIRETQGYRDARP